MVDFLILVLQEIFLPFGFALALLAPAGWGRLLVVR
jgi:hypothetical protein